MFRTAPLRLPYSMRNEKKKAWRKVRVQAFIRKRLAAAKKKEELAAEVFRKRPRRDREAELNWVRKRSALEKEIKEMRQRPRSPRALPTEELSDQSDVEIHDNSIDESSPVFVFLGKQGMWGKDHDTPANYRSRNTSEAKASDTFSAFSNHKAKLRSRSPNRNKNNRMLHLV
eukprot:TRINITY_DN19347_c0_g1_i2.p1 TRINITY_DN19347_c0_g1~~TRINITY_DN19347_c0_g1_i2.p1  ORF type:complete len:172 (+),score=4.87 TRINITY_DN19347_c0_g1_i2:43-558(+)